jgi:hypothetical protein
MNKILIVVLVVGFGFGPAWAQNANTDTGAETQTAEREDADDEVGDETASVSEEGSSEQTLSRRERYRKMREERRERRKSRAAGLEQDTLFGGAGEISHGGYGGPVVRYGRIAGQDAVLVGGRGGWLINHRLLVGLGGIGQAGNPAAPERIVDRYNRELDFSLGYGGFFTEYIVAPHRLIHGTVGVLVGAGGINLHHRQHHFDERRDGPFRNLTFFVVEPEIGLELNVVQFFRINLHGAYRVATGVSGIGFENSDFRGPSAGLNLKFGVF